MANKKELELTWTWKKNLTRQEQLGRGSQAGTGAGNQGDRQANPRGPQDGGIGAVAAGQTGGPESHKALEKTRNTKRRDLFDAQDAIDAQREELIVDIEKQLKQRRSARTLFAIRWEVI